MRTNNLDVISNFLKYTLLTGAVLYVVVYLVVVSLRIQYPFELMWQEGASVDHVQRIFDGYKYYVSPSLDFVPSIYTPLYFYISALLSKITGVGFLPLRLVSFLASLGCFYVIYLIVKKETGSPYYGILSVGLFAATYHISGAWFDIGRADSLFLLLLLAALYIIRFSTSPKSYLAAGILISLSFFTKQTALVISLPVMLSCLLLDRRSAVYFISPILVFIGLGSILLNVYYDGWFNYYVFQLPRTTPVNPEYLVTFWLKDIGEPLVIAFLIGIFYLLFQLLNYDRKKFIFYSLLFVGMFGASCYSRFRGGGFYNVLFPAYSMIAILFGLGLYRLFDVIQSLEIDKRNLIKIFLYLLCIAQFASGYILYNPLDQVPSKRDLEAGNKLIAKLEKIEGEIYSPFNGYLTVMAGKKSYANQMGMRDVLTTDSEEHAVIKDKLVDEIKLAMKEGKFSAILINSFEPWYPYDMKKYYAKKERIFDDEGVFLPVTAMKTRPEFIYVPRK